MAMLVASSMAIYADGSVSVTPRYGGGFNGGYGGYNGGYGGGFNGGYNGGFNGGFNGGYGGYNPKIASVSTGGYRIGSSARRR